MVFGGMTIRDYTYNKLKGVGEKLLEESWKFAELDYVLIDTTVSAASGGSDNQDSRLLSYFGRAQYNYDERYMADFTLRSDASSKLAEGSRTHYFPSASVGWNVSNEAFWNVPVINYFKIRASWGQNGSLGSLKTTETQALIRTDDQSTYFTSGGVSLVGSEPLQLANPDVVWETSQQTDIGVDVRLLQSRFAFTADYYIKKTIDLITIGSVPFYVGNEKPSANNGTIVNTGVELELIYKDVISDFSYQVGVNAAYNKNEVTDLPAPVLGANLGASGTITRADEGFPIWYFYGYQTDGIFDSMDEVRAYTNDDGELIQPLAIPGDVIFKDISKDGEISEDDKGMIGSPHPDWTFGFSANVSYKDIDLVVSVNGTLGNEVYFGAHRSDVSKNNKPLYFYEDAWTPENHTDEFPRYTVNDYNNNFTHSDLFVFDGSYLRMQNLELGYTLPRKISEKAKIQRLRVYVSGKNLFVLTSYKGGDPEIGNSSGDEANDMKSIGIDRGLYPKSKIYSFGVNLTL
jgi:TonB-linked SusC/RagA family outer membrane protein